MVQKVFTNQLINESSPYLLQHAHNPIDWQAWNDEALRKAKKENKLLLISIGYSACHWCHVMEHESFEDETVAAIMNEHFVCIKVDREERPDIDHIYMSAVQLLTGSGGWPLNCIALPDGRPIWGGTYFQKANWMETIKSIALFYASDKEKTENYATQLHEGIVQSTLIQTQEISPDPDSVVLQNVLSRWTKFFDLQHGGTKGAPKFMLPNNWMFLLRAGQQFKDRKILNQVKLSLQKMAFGGLYDQVGGGFARYSTDEKWKVPHFEKMLYDNAQMIQLFAQAWQTENNPIYHQVVAETIDFLNRELLSPENGFYSALDADSEGIEGKYYIWEKNELQVIITDDFELFSDYFNVNKTGYWEDEQYILLRTLSDQDFAEKHQLPLNELTLKIADWKEKLLNIRLKRVAPRLDDKILTSWNALTISGLVNCYRAFGIDQYLGMAKLTAIFLKEKMIKPDGSLMHTYKNGQAKINGFLDDYALSIEAFIALFEATGKKQHLDVAKLLTERVFLDFYDDQKKIFYYTASGQTDLIARTFEVQDNVIPSSNAVMATNLIRLSHLFNRPDYRVIASEMMENIKNHIPDYPPGYGKWSQVLLDLQNKAYEVCISGPKAIEYLETMQMNYLPDVVFCASTTYNELPLLSNRFVDDKTLIFICHNNTCQLPVESVEEAILRLSPEE